MKNFKVFPLGAYPFLCLDNKLFIKQCRVETYAASGPGGQKRNRTYSAVRITHVETGCSAIAEESRLQGENKLRAIKRLKRAIAVNVRKDPAHSFFEIHSDLMYLFRKDSSLQINQRNPLYPLFCATILDAVFQALGSIGDASKLLNITTGKLNKVLGRDKDLLNAANQLRQNFNFKPLKRR